MIDFIADFGAVVLMQLARYGERPDTDDRGSAIATENARLAELLREACVGFEYLCATWPAVFLAETHAMLAGIGVRVRPPDADLASQPTEGEADDESDDERGDGKDGGHASAPISFDKVVTEGDAS